MRFPDSEILVMARAPVAGRAKTRLIPALGAEGAAQLHCYLVERLLEELSGAALAPITVCCTPATDYPFFEHCARRYGVALQPQRGEDLGERLYHALAASLQHHRHAVVIGCDIPQLDREDLLSALLALRQGSDAVLSPTEDGGYALLGLNKVATALFEGVTWGSALVLGQTRQRLRSLSLNWQELRMQWDVDRPEDLARLSTLVLPPQLEDLLKQCGDQ